MVVAGCNPRSNGPHKFVNKSIYCSSELEEKEKQESNNKVLLQLRTKRNNIIAITFAYIELAGMSIEESDTNNVQ